MLESTAITQKAAKNHCFLSAPAGETFVRPMWILDRPKSKKVFSINLVRVRSRASYTGWGPRMRAHKIPECTKLLFSAQNDHKIDCADSPDNNAALYCPICTILRSLRRMNRARCARFPLCSSFSVYESAPRWPSPRIVRLVGMVRDTYWFKSVW